MADVVIIPRNTAIRLQRSWAAKICLPYTDCIPGHNYEPDCNCLNNGNFYWPVTLTDKIMLQTNMIDPINSPGNFTIGWTLPPPDTYGFEVEVLGCDGSVWNGTTDEFGDNYVVGYDGQGYYQTIELDLSKPIFALIPELFQVTIKRLGANPQTIYFPPMRVESCKNTVEVESTLTNYDCIGRFYGQADANNWFGTGNFIFDNWRRLNGSIETDSLPIESETTDQGVVTKKTSSRQARLRFEGMPEYMANELTSIHLGNNVKFNSIEYDNIPGLDKNNDESQLWYVDIQVLRTECEFGNDCD